MSHRVIGAVCSALFLTACGVSKDEFAAAQRDAANNQKKYEDEAQKNAALQKKVTDLQAQNAALTQSTTEAEAKSKQYEELAGSLKGQIQSGQVEPSELKGKMTVKLKDRVVFVRLGRHQPAGPGSARRGRQGLPRFAGQERDRRWVHRQRPGQQEEGLVQGQLGPLHRPRGERGPLSPVPGVGAEDAGCRGWILRVPAARSERDCRGPQPEPPDSDCPHRSGLHAALFVDMPSTAQPETPPAR